MRRLDRFRAIFNSLSGLTGGQRSLSSAAVHVDILQQQEVEKTAHLYCLEGQIEKATAGVAGHSTLAEEVNLLRRETTVHAPVIRYILRDCLVHEHGIEYCGGYVGIGRRGLANRLPRGSIEEIGIGNYCMTAVSRQYFGHWLQDACPTALLADSGEAVICDIRSDWPHTSQYIQSFGIGPIQSKNVFSRNLKVYQDFSQGSSKRQRYRTLRDRATQHFKPKPTSLKRIYLRRGTAGAARFVVNELDVIHRLDREGFEIVDIDGISVRQFFNIFSSSCLVVSMDGSHLNHLYYSMPIGSSILSFIPSDRFTCNNFGYASAVGIHFGMLVVDQVPGGYLVNLDEMMRTVELFPN